MTEPRDYSTWTHQDHLAQAERLAADADARAEHRIASEAHQQRADIEQITARARLHLELAREKKPAVELEPAPAAAPTPKAAPRKSSRS